MSSNNTGNLVVTFHMDVPVCCLVTLIVDWNLTIHERQRQEEVENNNYYVNAKVLSAIIAQL